MMSSDPHGFDISKFKDLLGPLKKGDKKEGNTLPGMDSLLGDILHRTTAPAPAPQPRLPEPSFRQVTPISSPSVAPSETEAAEPALGLSIPRSPDSQTSTTAPSVPEWPSKREHKPASNSGTQDLMLLLQAADKLTNSPPAAPATTIAPVVSTGDALPPAKMYIAPPARAMSAGQHGYARGRPHVVKRHKCHWENCIMSFQTRAELKCHVRTHTGEKPFACEWEGCGKRFAQSGGLVRHRRTHTGEKPYLCAFPNCGKAFAESGHLTRHSRSHTGDRAFACRHRSCSKYLASAYHLARHERIHDSTRPYICEQHNCIAAFAAPSELQDHLYSQHGLQATVAVPSAPADTHHW